MALLNNLLTHLAPHECLGCGAEGRLLCILCAQELPSLPPRCYRCGALSPGNETCRTCRGHSDLYAVWALTPYDHLAKELVWRLKYGGARDAAEEMAALMAPLLPTDTSAVLVPVPTATARVRSRGYDQAQLLARALARRTGLPYVPCLARMGQQHQVGAARQQRITQLQNAYRCTKPAAVQDKQVILVDDVLTTGATLEAAARVLKTAGTKRISGLVFAQA